MDEADILADRKVFMAHGRVQCQGTLLFLKHAFNIKYELVLNVAAKPHGAGLGAAATDVPLTWIAEVPARDAGAVFPLTLPFDLALQNKPTSLWTGPQGVYGARSRAVS
ncbi:hypothetical protein HK405_009613, partial [Cladochytrium tenue]